LKLGHQRVEFDLRFLQENFAVGGNRDGQWLTVSLHRLSLGFRQFDGHAHGEERCSHHEHDQQNEHHVDERRDVDLRV
jgi:hypothetical protein